MANPSKNFPVEVERQHAGSLVSGTYLSIILWQARLGPNLPLSPHLTIRSASLLSFYGPQNLLIDTESQVDTEPEHLSPVSTPTSRSPCSPHGKALQAVARSNPSSEPLRIFSPTTRDAGMQGLVRSVSAGLPWGIAAESYPCSPPLPVKSVGLCAAGDARAWRQRCSPTYCFCQAAPRGPETSGGSRLMSAFPPTGNVQREATLASDALDLSLF